MSDSNLDRIKDSIEGEDYYEGLLEVASRFEQLHDLAQKSGNAKESQTAQWEVEICNLLTATPFVRQDFKDRFISLYETADRSSKWPDIEKFSEERLLYYESRMDQTSNLFLKVRYADVLFENWNKCLKKNKREIAEILIDSLTSLGLVRLKKDLRQYLEIVQDFARAVDVALRLGIRDRIEELAERLMALLNDLVGVDTQYAYHISVIMRGIANSKLREAVSQDRYEYCAGKVRDAGSFYWNAKDYTWHREFCKELVAWGKTLRWDEAVIMAYQEEIGQSFMDEGEFKRLEQNSNMIKAHFLGKAAQHFINIGKTERLDAIKVDIKNAYEAMEANQELSEVRLEIPIPERMIEGYLSGYRNLTIERALEHLVTDPNLLVDVSTLEGKTREFASTSPVIAIAQKFILDGNRKVFSGETDEESIKLLADRDYYMGVGVVVEALLKRVFRVLAEEKGLSTEKVMRFLRKWTFWDEENTPIVQVGIERFFQKDFISGLHILVPQLEGYLRNAFARAGYSTTSFHKRTTQQEQTFTEFLKREDVRAVLPLDFLKYLEIVMVEQTGFNLRNNVAHGLISPGECTENNTAMVIHLFLLLTQIAIPIRM